MPTANDRALLASWDAVETAAQVRARYVTAAEVREAAIARAEAAGPLGAVVAASYERARRRVHAGPFAGVPTFIKDLARLRGVPIAWGSRGAGAYTPLRSDPFVRRVEGLGAVVLGKSATPELGLMATTEPLGRAPCRNPWDPTRSAGGSSGGAAALVAAGVVPIAHASDGGGSIRIPAACCGLVGYKPSRGRLDMEGSNLLPVNIATDGVVSRSVRDTVAFHEAMGSLPRERGDAPSRLRVGVFVDAPGRTAVDPAMQSAVRATGELCRDLGHGVEEIACPFPVTATDDFLTYWGLVAWIQVRGARAMLHPRFDVGRLEPWTLSMAATFTARRVDALAAIVRLRAFGHAYARVLSRYDVLVSPAVAGPAPALGHLATDLPFEELFARIKTFAPFTPLHNAAGAPAVSLPLGRTAAGLPLGVQLAAARGRDAMLLALAASIETAQPWPTVAPPERWAR